MMSSILCTQCGSHYPKQGAPYRCTCGGLFELTSLPEFITPNDPSCRGGVWRYAETIQAGQQKSHISLGEGNTPLISVKFNNQEIHLKMESQNPTGSYKDRGMVTLVDFLLSRGVKEVVEDSSGNAGASLAAYTARAGILTTIYAPESTSGPKRVQIERYGAKLVLVPGPRSAASAAVMEAVKGGKVYASHAYMPFGYPGIATMAFEIVEQLGCAPGTVIAPVGHGGLLFGLMLGFESLVAAGVTTRIPQYIGVQPANCAPLVETYLEKLQVVIKIEPKPTIAEGASVTYPSRAANILKRIYSGQGRLVAASEELIRDTSIQLSKMGIYCEPTSALSLIPLLDDKIEIAGPIVGIMTGSGLKAILKTE
jgi:threonine synthase